MRLMPMPVADLLDDEFESDALKGLIGALAVRNLQQGPRSGGTGFALLHAGVSCPPGVFRRTPFGNPQASGAETRRGVGVKAISVKEGRATGVVLESGEEIAAPLILSALDPKRTLLELVDPGWLDPELARSIRNIRSRGVAARVMLEVDRKPDFSALCISPTLDYAERAYDASKYGHASEAPIVEARASESRVEVHVQYVPHQTTSNVAATVVRVLSQHLPGFEATVTARGAVMPSDFERLHGWPQGQPHHAEITLDQAFWMRPVPELAQYCTPIGGLWLCGPAMHPGVPGVSGHNAARKALASA
jgi:phytoene dehydrogenase-like protein